MVIFPASKLVSQHELHQDPEKKHTNTFLEVYTQKGKKKKEKIFIQIKPILDKQRLWHTAMKPKVNCHDSL